MVPMTGGAGQQRAQPPRRAVSAIRGLHPVSFAFVMATGIISEGAFLLGPSWLSRVLLVVAAAVLAGLAAAAWLVLSYGVPASLLLARDQDSILGSVDSAWLLWPVGTQSLAVVAATLVPAWPSQSVLLASAAAGLWGIGLLLYLLLVAVILLRWLTVPVTPAGSCSGSRLAVACWWRPRSSPASPTPVPPNPRRRQPLQAPAPVSIT
jgi:Voltage-dependent anion channel